MNGLARARALPLLDRQCVDIHHSHYITSHHVIRVLRMRNGEEEEEQEEEGKEERQWKKAFRYLSL
jgi:hypothetical protein